MHLKDKYEQHKTDFDVAAWQHFKALKKQGSSQTKNNKPMNGLQSLYIILLSTALFIAVSGIVWLTEKQHFTNEGKTISSTKFAEIAAANGSDEKANLNDELQSNADEALSNQSTILSPKETIANTSKRANEKQEILQANESINEVALLEHKKASYQKTNSNKQFDFERNDVFKNAIQLNKRAIDHPQNSKTAKGETALDNIIRVDNSREESKVERTLLIDQNQKKVNNGNVRTELNGVSLLNASYKNIDTEKRTKRVADLNVFTKENLLNHPADYAVTSLQMIEQSLKTNRNLFKRQQQTYQPKLKSYKNSLKLNINYTTLYIGGYVPNGNPVKKRGAFIDLDLRRQLNQILTVGIGLGYSKGKDRNNPQLDIVDYEVDTHAHGRLYLFFVNKPKHKLFIKGGTGLSYSERIYSSYSSGLLGEVTRNIHENRFFYVGFTFEVAYEQRIADQLFVGIQTGISSGNDGFTYPGISVGYSF